MEEKLQKEVQVLIKNAKKQGSITEEEIGTKLIEFDLSSDDMKDIIDSFQKEGITVESIDEEIIKDEDLKDIIEKNKDELFSEIAQEINNDIIIQFNYEIK